MDSHYSRDFEAILLSRLKEDPRHIQVVIGPRQVGKTSGVLNVLETHFKKTDYAFYSSEEDIFESDWFLAQVQKSVEAGKKIIIFDEVQKIDRWSELVKLAWDQQKKNKSKIHWVLLGSSSLEITQGLNDSLAGRFEVIPVHHWGFHESKKAFGLSLEQYLTYGGYPGSYHFIKDENRFKRYVLDSIFETVVSRDILRYVTVKKPALFRQTFVMTSQFPAQEISYNKLLGQLQDAGNVDQIKNYLDLFSKAFLLKLVFKWSKSNLSRTSSPKIVPMAPVFHALFIKRKMNSEDLGRAFEGVVGKVLLEKFESVYFWRDGNEEVDYVVEYGKVLFAIEVKSKKRNASGLTVFRQKFNQAKSCMIDFENYESFELDPIAFLNRHAV
jgi:predicted AAA+ superfamily ATPase